MECVEPEHRSARLREKGSGHRVVATVVAPLGMVRCSTYQLSELGRYHALTVSVP